MGLLVPGHGVVDGTPATKFLVTRQAWMGFEGSWWPVKKGAMGFLVTKVSVGHLVSRTGLRCTSGGQSGVSSGTPGGQVWGWWDFWQSEMTLVGFVVATAGPPGGQRSVWGGW